MTDAFGNPTAPVEGVPLWSGMARYARASGPPGGVLVEGAWWHGAIVASAYDEAGRPVSVVVAWPEGPARDGRVPVEHVVSMTRADARRMGHASRLYRLLDSQGVDVLDPASPDRTEAGLAFVRGLWRSMGR